jgi:hypothetical protein
MGLVVGDLGPARVNLKHKPAAQVLMLRFRAIVADPIRPQSGHISQPGVAQRTLGMKTEGSAYPNGGFINHGGGAPSIQPHWS